MFTARISHQRGHVPRRARLAVRSRGVADASALTSHATHDAAMRPHVLLMLADDWGSYDASHRIRALGREPDVQTPEIDQLTAAGVQFDNYYVQPICSPTRASLLSGRYSIHTGAEHRLWGSAEPSCLPTTTPLLPRAFKALNYSTHMVGKWYAAPPPTLRGRV